MVILVNGTLVVSKLSDFSFSYQLDLPEGVSSFAARKFARVSDDCEEKICASIGKTLHLCSLKDKQGDYATFTLSKEPTSLLWVDDQIYLAFKRGYAVIESNTGKVSEVMDIKDATNTNFCWLPTEEVLLSASSRRKTYFCSLFSLKIILSETRLELFEAYWGWGNDKNDKVEEFPEIFLLLFSLLALHLTRRHTSPEFVLWTEIVRANGLQGRQKAYQSWACRSCGHQHLHLLCCSRL